MIIDNEPYHTAIEEVFAEEEFLIHQLLRLGLYSLMLNAIEYDWFSLKASVKPDLAFRLCLFYLVVVEDAVRKLNSEYNNYRKNNTR